LHSRRDAASPGPDPLRATLILAAVAAAWSALLFGFRRVYFGAFFPNPVYSKGTAIHVWAGLSYVWSSLRLPGTWLVLAVPLGLGVVAKDALGARGARPGAVLAAAFAFAYLGFIILVGGDWMHGGRFLAHAIPVLVVVAVIGLSRVLRAPRVAGAAIGAGVLLNVGAAVALADTTSTGRPIWSAPALLRQLDERVGPRGFGFFEIANRVHLRDATVSAELIDLVTALRKAHPDRKFLMMSSQAGMVAYHAFAVHGDALRFVDMCSLTTRELRLCVPSRLEHRQVGLQLSFDRYFHDEAVIDRACGTTRPDIVVGLGHRNIEPVLEKNGYTLVYRQHGGITNEGLGKWFHAPLSSEEFIGVDTALLKEAHYEQKPPYSWDIR
jgi:hypothetical protein